MADDLTLRRARKRDQDRVAALWVAFLEEQAAQDPRFQLAEDVRERFDNDFPVWIDDETQRTFVAEQRVAGEQRSTGEQRSYEDTLVGFATAHRWGPPPIYAEASEVFVDEFYVAPEARGKGAGRRLAGALRAWAEELEADRLRLRVLHANEAGRAFWRHVGAEPFATTMTVELGGGGEKEKPERQRMGF